MLFWFAARGESLVASIESLRGAPRVEPRGFRRRLLSVAQLFADEGMIAIVPGGFDEDAAQMRITRLGDRPTSPRGPTRMLGGDESDIGHQAARGREAARVTQFGGDRQRRDVIHAAEAPEALDPRPQGLQCHQLLDRCREAAAVPEKKFGQSMPRPQQIRANVFAATQEIPNRFLL